jgi:SPP1 family predicted phage head-tail adaptor
MRAGLLDRFVRLQRRTLTRDAVTGEQVESFADYASVWASKRDLRGREFFAAQQVNAEISTVWQIRYRSGVLLTDRLVCDWLSYSITGIAEVGRRTGLELQTTAVPA